MHHALTQQASILRSIKHASWGIKHMRLCRHHALTQQVQSIMHHAGSSIWHSLIMRSLTHHALNRNKQTCHPSQHHALSTNMSTSCALSTSCTHHALYQTCHHALNQATIIQTIQKRTFLTQRSTQRLGAILAHLYQRNAGRHLSVPPSSLL